MKCYLLIALLLLVPCAAFAQTPGDAGPASAPSVSATDAGPPRTVSPVPVPTINPPAVVPLDPGSNPSGTAKAAVDAVRAGDWRLVAILVLVLLVWGLRYFGGKLWAGFKTDRAGAILALATGIVGTVATLWIAAGVGKGLSGKALLDGILLGANIAGGWVLVKKIVAPSDAKAADPPKG